MYTFGSNHLGQLGRGKVVLTPWIPGCVEGDLKGERVKKVVTSGANVLAVSGIVKLINFLDTVTHNNVRCTWFLNIFVIC